MLRVWVSGIPHPIKLQEQHRAAFPTDRPISEESGKLIAVWANGGSAPRRTETAQEPKTEAPPSAPPRQTRKAQGRATAGGEEALSPVDMVRQAAEVLGLGEDDLLGYMGTDFGESLEALDVEVLRDLYRDVKNGSVSRWAATERGFQEEAAG